MPTVRLIISGKVQGVFFRASTKRFAEKSGVVGWVKNRKDGAVEIVATGSDSALQEFSLWCNKGPDGANVIKIETEILPEKHFEKFEIIKELF